MHATNNNFNNNSNNSNNNRSRKKKKKNQWNDNFSNFGSGGNNFGSGYNNGAMGTGSNPATNQFDRKNWPMEVCSQTVPKYCWTNGWDCNHTSSEFRRRAAGHQNNATKTTR